MEQAEAEGLGWAVAAPSPRHPAGQTQLPLPPPPVLSQVFPGTRVGVEWGGDWDCSEGEGRETCGGVHVPRPPEF